MTMQWESVIGLELHVQLATQSKIFSGAANRFGEPPNTLACAVDLGLPGVLPVANEEVIRMAVMFGLAVDASIAREIRVCPEKLFLPGPAQRLPDQPVRTAHRERQAGYKSRLTEQSGKSASPGRISKRTPASPSMRVLPVSTGIDLNRAGAPLIEIVSEPDLRSAREAVALHEKNPCPGALPGDLRREHAGGILPL